MPSRWIILICDFSTIDVEPATSSLQSLFPHHLLLSQSAGLDRIYPLASHRFEELSSQPMTERSDRSPEESRTDFGERSHHPGASVISKSDGSDGNSLRLGHMLCDWWERDGLFWDLNLFSKARFALFCATCLHQTKQEHTNKFCLFSFSSFVVRSLSTILDLGNNCLQKYNTKKKKKKEKTKGARNFVLLTWLESSAAVLYSSLYLLDNSQAAVSALSSPVHVCRWRLRCLVLGCQSLVANRFVDCSLSFVERTANGTGHLLGHRCVRDTRQGSICSSGFGSICSSGFVTKLSFSGGRGGRPRGRA